MATENYCSSAPGEQIPIAAADSRSKLEDDEDVLVQVLIRLPCPRSAWRCKPVCKRWNSLISTPYFSRCFVSHHQSLSAGEPEPRPLFPSKARALISTFLPLPAANFELRILDCFKDLLLLGVEVPDQYVAELGRTYLVCNPFTKEWVALPLAPERRRLPVTPLVVRLVCKPYTSSITLVLGIDGAKEEEEESCIYHSGYRFRVVLMPLSNDSQVDVFCSESGEWTEVYLDGLRGDLALSHSHLVSVNGEVYWRTRLGQVVGWNPFCLDGTPPTIISQLADKGALWTSQGTLCMIVLEFQRFGDSRDALSVWKLEEEEGGSSSSSRSWRRQYEVALNKKFMCKMRKVREVKLSEMERVVVVGQHKEKPEIVLLECVLPGMSHSVVFCCNLKTEALELFPDRRAYLRRQRLFQCRYDLWPTRIPSYEKLCGMYDGSYPWLQLV